MTTRFLTALAVSAALALAGCGGSSKLSSTASPSTPTGSVTSPAVTSFTSTLGALCVRANRAFGSASGVKAQSAVVEHYVARFRSLKPPPQLSALYARYVSVLAQESAALRSGNTADLQQLVSTRARPLAKKLGALGCVT